MLLLRRPTSGLSVPITPPRPPQRLITIIFPPSILYICLDLIKLSDHQQGPLNWERGLEPLSNVKEREIWHRKLQLDMGSALAPADFSVHPLVRFAAAPLLILANRLVFIYKTGTEFSLSLIFDPNYVSIYCTHTILLVVLVSLVYNSGGGKK